MYNRYEKSLGLLTTRFVTLLQKAKDGVLDLKIVSISFKHKHCVCQTFLSTKHKFVPTDSNLVSNDFRLQIYWLFVKKDVFMISPMYWKALAL